MAVRLRKSRAEVEETIDRFVQSGMDLMAESENLDGVFDIEEWVHKTEAWHALTRAALRDAYDDGGDAGQEFLDAATGGIVVQWGGQGLGDEFVSRRGATERGIRTLRSLRARLEFAEEGPGAPDKAEGEHGRAPQAKDPRRVMVVHGRNARAQEAMFTFLRALGLSPLEWEQAIAQTRVGSPHNLDAVRAAMSVAQAVVVLLTAEDRAGLLPELAAAEDDDTRLQGQPRQNVTLEAGLAMGVDSKRVVLVELGPIRRASDFEGLNAVRLTNDPRSRGALRSRLETAGCVIDQGASGWMVPETGGDFEGAIVRWEPQRVSEADV
jgi:predicted nucleotide-binding protein